MASLNTNISPSPVVAVKAKSGNTQTSATNSVTVSLAENPTGATLSGTLTRSASAGLATFNDLKLNRSGSGFQLLAVASGLTSFLSAPFSIPTHLVFTTQPSGTNPGDPVIAVVTAEDTAGNTDTNFTGSVTVSLFSNPTGATLGGTLTVAAVAGVASFSDLTVNIAGTYTLQAACND